MSSDDAALLAQVAWLCLHRLAARRPLPLEAVTWQGTTLRPRITYAVTVVSAPCKCGFTAENTCWDEACVGTH